MSAEQTEKPITLRLDAALKIRLTKIAEVNHISVADVIRICLAQGLPPVEAGQIVPSKEKTELGFELHKNAA